MRIWLAIRTFFRVLGSSDYAAGVEQLQLEPPQTAPELAAPEKPVTPAAPARNDAITLLATLQREARFVDIVSESLDGYSNDQIGAAARDVLKDCGKVIERMFAVAPVTSQQEGESMQVDAGYDVGTFRLTGAISGDPPFNGQLVHAGWVATKCELPQWAGTDESAMVVAPAEVQVG